MGVMNDEESDDSDDEDDEIQSQQWDPLSLSLGN
jgi:hypothetical protein